MRWPQAWWRRYCARPDPCHRRCQRFRHQCCGVEGGATAHYQQALDNVVPYAGTFRFDKHRPSVCSQNRGQQNQQERGLAESSAQRQLYYISLYRPISRLMGGGICHDMIWSRRNQRLICCWDCSKNIQWYS